MDDRRFDHLARLAAISRRRLLIGACAGLIAGVTRSTKTAARAQGIIALGGACTTADECQEVPGPGSAMMASCADNGFASDGPLNCCLDLGSCCGSDVDCCSDLRCFAWPDVCFSCQPPPFPTRRLGEPCVIDAECIPYPPNSTRCVAGLCASTFYPDAAPQPMPTTEAAMLAAELVSELEAAGRFGTLYDQMHPDAQRVIPREAVIGWYEEDFDPRGAEPAMAVKVRFAPWTWEVTGQTYPEAAEVAYQQRFADGSEVRGEVRLVQDFDGNWGWFFGRDRAFVEEQMARFGASPATPAP